MTKAGQKTALLGKRAVLREKLEEMIGAGAPDADKEVVANQINALTGQLEALGDDDSYGA